MSNYTCITRQEMDMIRLRSLENQPIGIGKKVWDRWKDIINTDLNPQQYLTLSQEIEKKLEKLERSTYWEETTFHCLDLMWSFLNRLHSEELPEMACQRSGNCCHRQTPRVSLFEIRRMAHYIASLPAEKQKDIIKRCYDNTNSKFDDSIIGAGVPCPMLEKDESGKSMCAVHPYRPVICRVSAVAGHNSWDCPIWKVYGSKFPTLDPEIVKPYLRLFNYGRNVFAVTVLEDFDLCQMALIGPGILHVLGGRANVEDKNVTAMFGHKAELDESLYLRRLGDPTKASS
jgi:Fe-S-cluster containining protein